jgi:hypothetical protein
VLDGGQKCMEVVGGGETVLAYPDDDTVDEWVKKLELAARRCAAAGMDPMSRCRV